MNRLSLMTSWALLTSLMACEEEKLENIEDSGVVEDIDSDGDGVLDAEDDFPEDPNESKDTDEDGVGDNADTFPEDPNESVDSDEDGVGDNADAFPDDPGESMDSDEDGLGDNAEQEGGTDPNNADSDGDGINDGEEVANGTDPSNEDSDGDGLTDSEEVAEGTDPTNGDSDGDGATDGEEVTAGTDPNDPNSGGADPILPTEGFWAFDSPAIGADGCNIGSILTTFGMGIGDIIPEGFDVSGVGSASFTGSMSGSSTTCTLTGGNFSCGSITTTETFDLSQAGLSGTIDIEMEVSLDGMMSDAENMELDLGLDVVSCNGASCSLLSFIGLSIPCSVEVTGTATLN